MDTWVLWMMLQWIRKYKYLFEILFVFLGNLYPEVELLDPTVALFLIYWETSILFSIVAAPVYIPTNNARGFPFLHILADTCYLLSFDHRHSDRYEICLVMGLICISLVKSCWAPFGVQFGHLHASLEKCPFRSSAHLEKLLKCSWFMMLCSFLLYSKVIPLHTHTHEHTYILFHILFYYGLSQDIEYGSLFYIVGLCCLPTLYIIISIC